ncbi:MAG: hypothetical protein KKH40_03825, partial [Nanoarchaeota archaeon]|nr:hypothetical protein [Nanoarchaeota archaeon]
MNKLPTFPEVVEEKKRSPLRYILAVFLIFLLIVMIIPYYNIKLDPRPENIPSVEDVFFFEGTLSNK